MVAVGGESPLDLQEVLGALESKMSSSDQRLEAYTKLTSQLVDGQLSIFERDIQEQGVRLVKVAKRDLTSSGGVTDSVAKKALHVMTYCLCDNEIVSFIAASELSMILNRMCDMATGASEKTIVASALMCLARQAISHAVVSAQVPQILVALELTRTKWKSSVDHEVLSVLLRLCEQCEKYMELNCPAWGRLVLPLLISPVPKVPERAYDCVQKWAAAFSSSADFVKAAAPDVRSALVPGLKSLFKDGQEMYTIKVWELLVCIFHEEISNTHFGNDLLSVIELAFRATQHDSREHAFHAWHVFIDIMAKKSNWLTEPRHIKLVMVVFMKNNARTEAVQLEKLKAWWHLICCLDTRLWDNFDLVIKNLLCFCVGHFNLGSSNPVNPGTPPTPRMSLDVGLKSPVTPRGTAGTKFAPTAKIQLLGLEILAHLLGVENAKSSSLSHISSLEPLKDEVMVSPMSFIKNAAVLISAMFDLIKSQGTQIPELLLMRIWNSMVCQLRLALESSQRASERREPLSVFLGQFQVLVLSQILPCHLILRMFQSVFTLPHKILASTAFSVSGQDVKGSPAQFLCEVLLTPTLLKECTNNESFITALTQLVKCGKSHPAGVLDFCQGVVELLDRNAQFIPGPEVFWRLWSIVAHPLQDHIAQTNEVNQGDSLEYNFDCLYSTLLLPISHHLGATVSQPTCKTLMKTWSELYRTFSRLSALVTNAEANIVVETMSQRILETLKKDDSYCLKSAAMLEFVMTVCQVIVDTIDFSPIAPPQTFGLGGGLSASLSKWSRRRQKPMGNIHSFVSLVAVTMEGIMEGVNLEGEEPPVFAKQKPSESAAQLNVAAVKSLDIVTMLVTHITVPSIIGHMVEKLAPSLAELMKMSTKKTPVKLHTPAALQKLEKLWLDMCTMLQSRYNGPYDSSLLAHLAPILQATFLHPRRQIKNQTVILWNATFSRSAPLMYPSDLQPVLVKVKEKTQILLPGWVNIDVSVIEETPFSQMSQPDSMAPEPVIPGMPSPTRVRGSFLCKDLSPSPKAVSPAKRVNPLEFRPFGGSARKKLSVDLMPEEDFVVITNTPKKKRVLTEHQKEVLKEKAVIPAMYNNLDASQDVSLMSQFSMNDTQQDTMQTHTSTADCVIMVNSSQSQELQKEGVDEAKKPTASEDQMPAPILRRSCRRKSVHFEDSSSSVAGPKDSDSSSGERPWKLSSAETFIAEVSAPLTTFTKENEVSSKSSSDDNVKSGDDKAPSLPSPQPNLLATMGEKLVETLSSKETSLSSAKSSSLLSGDEKVMESSDENDPFFRPFKSLSQSPPLTRSHLAEKTIPDNSVRMMTRKTRSQEIVGSVMSTGKEPALKGAGDQPSFTSLDKWLRKTPVAGKNLTVTGKMPVDSIPESPEMIADSPPTVKATMLVEETQSPKKLAGTQKTSVSILETPTKTSPALSPSGTTGEILNLNFRLHAAATDTVKSSSGRLHESMLENSLPISSEDATTVTASALGLELKQPVLMLDCLSKADLVEKSTVTSVASHSVPMKVDGTDAKIDPEPRVGLDPSVVTNKDASHRISSDVHCVSSLDLIEGLGMKENKTGRANDNSDHENLFGFSELLPAIIRDDEHKETGSSSGQKIVLDSENINMDEEMSESLLASTIEGGHALSADFHYNPALTSTLLQTPPRGHISLQSHKDSSDSPSLTSQKYLSESQIDGTPSSNSQTSVHSDSEGVDFDPTKDSTLTEAADHVNKRKQRTPKKIEFPEKLRRTPRRKKARKSICACCKDGPNPDHGKAHKERKSSQEENRGDDGSQKGDNVVQEEEQQNTPEKMDKTEDKEVTPLLLTTDELLESMGLEESEIEKVSRKENKAAPSPQDLGEKTPELKSSTSITPLRKSTTKSKMEVARRRSISKSLSASLEKSACSDSDSDDVPLSQLAQPSREKVTSIVDKGSSATEEKKVGSSPRSGRIATPLRSASKLKLKKLFKERPDHSMRSTPRLRLRQRQDQSTGEKGTDRLPENVNQTEVKTPTKGPAVTSESQIEDVASGEQHSQDNAESVVIECTPVFICSGTSKSTIKKSTRSELVKRLSLFAGQHFRRRSTGTRRRTRTRGRRLSSPHALHGAGSHKKHLRTSPACIRQLRKRACKKSQQQDNDVKLAEDAICEDVKTSEVSFSEDSLDDDQPLAHLKRSEEGPSPRNSSEVPSDIPADDSAMEQFEPVDLETTELAEMTVVAVAEEETSVADSVATPRESSGQADTHTDESAKYIEGKESGSQVTAEDKESTMKEDHTVCGPSKYAANDKVNSEDFRSTNPPCLASQTEGVQTNTPTENENRAEEATAAAGSEDMFDSLGFSLDLINSKQTALPLTDKITDTESDQLSAALFSEPDIPSDMSKSPLGEELEIGMFAQSFTEGDRDSQDTNVGVLAFEMSNITDSPLSATAERNVPVEISGQHTQVSGENVPCDPSNVNDADFAKPETECASVMSVESSSCDAFSEHGTQTNFETSSMEKSDKIEICGLNAQKSQAESCAPADKNSAVDAGVQTEQHKTIENLDTDTVADEVHSVFCMFPKDAALKITPLKRKRSQDTQSCSASTSPASPVNHSHSMTLSDSKMFRVQRLQQKFRTLSDRGMSMVRHSLLQRQLQKQQFGGYISSQDSTASPTKDMEVGSTPGENITVVPVCPTSGILKKRPQDCEVSQDEAANATPIKKRRVSFADPVVSGESPSHEATLSRMPWRWESVPKKQSMPREVLSDDNQPSKPVAQSSAGTQPSQPSQGSPSSYHSTQESQLNATDPIFPDLVDCEKSVEKVLPQLTSAAWHRGLNQLLAANGITTIGNLASQTEVDVQSMPFRAPKVEVVRSALQQYYRQHFAKKSPAKSANSGRFQDKAAKQPDTSQVNGDNESLPNAEEALHQLSPIKGESVSTDIEESDVFEDEGNTNLDQPMEDLDDEMITSPRISTDQSSSTQERPSSSTQTEKASLLEKFMSLAEADLSELQRMKKDELSTLHEQLSMLTNKVVGALINRCPSPPDSQ